MSRIRHTFTTICLLAAVLPASSSASPAQRASAPARSLADSARQCPRTTVQTPTVTASRIDSLHVTLPAIPGPVTGTYSIKRRVWPIAAVHRSKAVGGAVRERSIDSTRGQRPPAPARPPPRRLAHTGQRN